MPRYTVKLRNVTIGWSDLEQRDAQSGAASGAFRPGPGYELVQPVFRLFSESQREGLSAADAEATLGRYYAARDRLGLTLHSDDGAEIPTHFIHIVDFTVERGRKALELQVEFADTRIDRMMEQSDSRG